MTGLSANTGHDLPSEARAEAAAWIARLHGPQRSAALEAGFRRWLESNPHNAQAFERMTEIWDAVAGTPAGRFPRVSVWARGRRVFAEPRRLAVAAAMVVAIGVAGFAAHRLLSDPVYATAVGMQRTVHLKDGSEVTLNSNTRLTVAYTTTDRQIALERGEAFFDVAADQKRPFVVTAGDHRVTALGTSFIVRHESDSTAVTLMEGKVVVAPVVAVGSMADAPRRDDNASNRLQEGAVTLVPGERFTVSAKRSEQLDKPAVDALAAWRHGVVVLDHTPLAEAAAEMNRYSSSVIVIDDERAAEVRISGNYRTGDPEGFARAVASMYGLEVTQRGGRIYLHEPAR